MNKADNAASTKAVDSLINFETVKVTIFKCAFTNMVYSSFVHHNVYKYFNNEQHEADQYDKFLAMYETASLKTTTSLALLNFSQNFVFSTAITAAMLMSAQAIQSGQLLHIVS